MAPSARPDEDLVALAIGGDQRALAALFRVHMRHVATVVCRLLGRDDGEVDDIVQQAFIQAAARLTELRATDKFRPWVVSIAVRCCWKSLAKRRRWWLWTRDYEQMVPNPGASIDAGQTAALLGALDRLPTDERVPWVLHTVQGETLPEVARLCDISLATAKRRIARAHARVRRRLGDS
jgi:RNA polymerase sigma-70 factor (ECF subfamily)